MKQWLILLICGMIIGGVIISGCTDNSSTTTQKQPTTSYQKHTIVCPNPDCPLHVPNGYAYFGGGSGNSNVRPIDMEVGDTTAGGTKTVYYLCQVCGEKWEE